MDHENLIPFFIIEKATLLDVGEICRFTDFWIAGRGKNKHTPGATNDYFISPGQHKKYIRKYDTSIIRIAGKIIAWAVIQHDGSLIHLLVAGNYRHLGIGSRIVQQLNPPKIRSKSNQQSGNPQQFYKKLGYNLVESVKPKSRFNIDIKKPNRKMTIDIFTKG